MKYSRSINVKDTMKSYKIIRIVMLSMGILSLLNGILYTLITRVNIGSSIQILISLGLIIYAVFLFKIPKKIHIVSGIVCLIPIIMIMFLMIYGNSGSLDYNEDVVIIMGAGVMGETVSRPLAHRLNTALHYLEKNPNALVIVCGGMGDRATITEAEAMKRFLVRRGIEPERIIKEDKSTNSFENLTFAKEILDTYFPDGFRAVLVTSDFHLFRTNYVASNIGITANRLGARIDFISVPTSYLRELLAIANVLIFPPFEQIE